MYYDTRSSRGRIPLVMRLVPIAIAAAMIGFTMLRGCQEGPFGRQQVVAMNPQEEAQLGLQAFQEVLSDAKVVQRGPTVQVVREIAQRLVNATAEPQFLERTHLKRAQFEDFDWQVEVVESQEVNAFCLPGGKIVVYTGILPVAQTDAGLATVMGHEIAHALAHHGAERMAQQQMVQIGMRGVQGSLGDLDYNQQAAVMQILNAGAKYGILGYSRKHESEADHLGLLLMATAGYDPREAIRFWERMQQASGGRQSAPEFASTHPSHRTRIADLNELQAEAMPLYEASRSQSRTKLLPGIEVERQ
jgi:predicted Zn-dependent protease